ncbi:MAG: 50S ribosomal protein L18 [Cyanobacteria bacterium P01_D01_bin.56]
MKATRKKSTQRRHARIRRRIKGTAERPRLAVYRSNNHIYAQVIDDYKHHTLAAASTLDVDVKGDENSSTRDASAKVGKLVAERSLAQGIKQVVFDRGGKLYHGRVASLAEAAREAGLDF